MAVSIAVVPDNRYGYSDIVGVATVVVVAAAVVGSNNR